MELGFAAFLSEDDSKLDFRCIWNTHIFLFCSAQPNLQYPGNPKLIPIGFLGKMFLLTLSSIYDKLRRIQTTLTENFTMKETINGKNQSLDCHWNQRRSRRYA